MKCNCLMSMTADAAPHEHSLECPLYREPVRALKRYDEPATQAAVVDSTRIEWWQRRIRTGLSVVNSRLEVPIMEFDRILELAEKGLDAEVESRR